MYRYVHSTACPFFNHGKLSTKLGNISSSDMSYECAASGLR